jgi:peptide methionine sulfoxide reductase msrA/msrB
MLNGKSILLLTVPVIAFSVLVLQPGDIPGQPQENQKETQEASWKSQVQNKTPKNATFAGGCFWCIEGVYMDVKGVKSAVSGYAGGKKQTATYSQVTTGNTDHREAVRVRYYPSIISYKELLDMYWRSIDPTDPGGQFSDRGPQYTTAIYTHTPKQYKLAKKTKENLSKSGKFKEPIVTKIKNYTTFFKAEERHQNYSKRKTLQYKAYEKASGRKGFIEKIWDKNPFN